MGKPVPAVQFLRNLFGDIKLSAPERIHSERRVSVLEAALLMKADGGVSAM